MTDGLRIECQCGKLIAVLKDGAIILHCRGCKTRRDISGPVLTEWVREALEEEESKALAELQRLAENGAKT